MMVLLAIDLNHWPYLIFSLISFVAICPMRIFLAHHRLPPKEIKCSSTFSPEKVQYVSQKQRHQIVHRVYLTIHVLDWYTLLCYTVKRVQVTKWLNKRQTPLHTLLLWRVVSSLYGQPGATVHGKWRMQWKDVHCLLVWQMQLRKYWGRFLALQWACIHPEGFL